MKHHVVGFLRSPVWLAVLGVVLCVGRAQGAAWSCIHGHSGNFEFPNHVVTLTQTHIGFGLDFEQKPGLHNWIHFAPPSVLRQNVRYIGLQFWTGSTDAIVDKVHVYSLGNRVKEFNNLGWSDGWHTEVLDLGSDLPFDAIGISVEVDAGIETKSHAFLFTGACAYIDP